MRQVLSLLPFFLAGSLSCFGALDQALIALVPADSKLIASIDVTSAGNSEFGQYFLKRVDSEDKGLQNFVQQTGFDPRRDLQDLVFASSGTAGTSSNSRGVILARGSFDISRLKAMAEAHGSSVEQYQGTDLLINKHDKNALAFPETGVAVLGDVDSVRNVIAHRSNPAALDPAVTRQIERIGAANDVWFVSPSGAQFLANAGAQFQNAQTLQSILQSSGGIHFGETVRLSLDAVTRSPEDANSLVAVVRFVAGMAQTQDHNSQQMAILASSLNAMDIQVSGSNVHMSMSVSEKNLEQIAQLEGKHSR